jgi:hypothetical protein
MHCHFAFNEVLFSVLKYHSMNQIPTGCTFMASVGILHSEIKEILKGQEDIE